MLCLVLCLLFLASLVTQNQSSTSFTSFSNLSIQVIGKIKDVLNGTRFRNWPEKVPIVWRHLGPSMPLVEIALTTSATSLGGAVATINSVHLNTKHPVRFHIFVPANDEDGIHHLANWMSETHLRDIDYEIYPFDTSKIEPRLVTSKTVSRHELASSAMNFARYYVPSILAKMAAANDATVSGRRLIHLDDDVIVQGDIFDLWNQTFDSNTWTAFANDCTGQPKHSLHHHFLSAYVNFADPRIKALKISPGKCAMNTGVYVYDLNRWLASNITGQLDYWWSENQKSNGNLFNGGVGNEGSAGYSGPPLMLIFHSNYTEIDPMWHVRGLGELNWQRLSQHFLEKARLLHWSGPEKPWGRIDADRGRDIWDTYYVHDPWGQFKVIRKPRARSSRIE